MRFLVMVILPKENEGITPSPDMLRRMGAFNDTLVKDGVLLAAEGLQPSAKGARMSFKDGKPRVTDGPFTESKELVAGFWLMQGHSKEEIIERLSRCPFELGEAVEIRPLYEAEDLAKWLEVTPAPA
jgi:hypothetical protein